MRGSWTRSRRHGKITMYRRSSQVNRREGGGGRAKCEHADVVATLKNEINSSNEGLGMCMDGTGHGGARELVQNHARSMRLADRYP